MLFGSLTLGALVACALAAPHQVRHVLHEKRSERASQGWLRRREVPTGKTLPVRIGMTQSNMDEGHDLLMDLSNPKSANYGKHLTADEVREMFAPKVETVNAIQEWLKEHGVTTASQSHNKQWLQFDLEVEKLEDMLRTKYHEYEHEETGTLLPACEEYHVPHHLVDHIDYITPGIGLIKRNAQTKFSTPFLPPIVEGKPPAEFFASNANDPLSYCTAVTTPDCVFAMYNFTQGTTAFPGNQMGIFETELQFYGQSELDLLYANLAPWVPKGTSPIIRGVDGGGQAVKINKAAGYYSYVGIEAQLDFSAAIPLVYPQSTVLWQTDDYNNEEAGYYGFTQNMWNALDGSYCSYSAYGITGNSPGIDPMYPDPTPIYGYNHTLQCGAYKPTNVISISYALVEFVYPTAYLQRQCSEILKLSLQGVTVVSSSGDYGVAGNGGECMENNAFAPLFPTSCPYVVSVGSTYLPPGASVTGDQEAASNEFGAGGGFSNVFPPADWQKSAIAKYFKTTKVPYPSYSILYNSTYQDPNGGLYNRAGRGIPDVSAIGENYLLYDGTFSELVGGTSLSSPIFGSILTRINELRLAAGKTTVGAVHQALYANPSMFHDVTKGDNPGCGTNGFKTAKGWDPVSGLGTPNFGLMADYFMSLP